jgi:hypothetical protein
MNNTIYNGCVILLSLYFWAFKWREEVSTLSKFRELFRVSVAFLGLHVKPREDVLEKIRQNFIQKWMKSLKNKKNGN